MVRSPKRTLLQSKLLLSDWQTEPLTVLDLISQNLESSQLAYLSACHTASTRDLSLLDEAIHLASAIQMAGYPSVIGSLWQVVDEHSAVVAKEAYSWMLEGAENYVDVQKSAEALHRAVSRLREKTRTVPRSARKNQSDPLVWASYIHMGI